MYLKKMTFTIKKKKTIENLAQIDGIAVFANEMCLNITCVLPDIDEDEISGWQNGYFVCALYYDKKVPFFTLWFEDMFFADYLAFKNLTFTEMLRWLRHKNKYINLLLIEKNGLEVKASYRISLSEQVVNYLKKILLVQMLLPYKLLKQYAVKLTEKGAEKMFAAARIIWMKQ